MGICASKLFLVLVTSACAVQAQEFLSDSAVRSAIGGNCKGHSAVLTDKGTAIATALMTVPANQEPSIGLYMPECILALKSASARKQFLKYVPDTEDRRTSLTIVANGWIGGTIRDGCASITRIVLVSDKSGRVTREAYLSDALPSNWQNGYGATTSCQDLRAKFKLSDVAAVQAAAEKKEFYVAVFAGGTNTKMYKVKEKYLADLGLIAKKGKQAGW
jgi:hypothetical protein